MSTQGSEAELERARLELQRLGYLDHGLERFLLQDALRPRRPLRTLALLTAKVALLGGGLLAAALAVALAVANGSVLASPLDLPVLFVHLFPPLAAVVAAAFLALASAVLLVWRFFPVRRIDAMALATALVVGLAALVLALWQARELLIQRGPWQRVALALAAAAVAYALVRLIHQGLLALAIRFIRGTPAAGRLAWRWRRWVSGAALAGVLLLAVPVLLAARDLEPPPPPLLPVAPGERVLIIGLDGVLPVEIEYLLRRGDLPAMARLERGGGRLLRYARRVEPPAAFWTSLATGLAPSAHGVAALDSFLPLGARVPLAGSGLLRAYWSRVEVPLRLSEYRPVMANRRGAFALWELASRGGAPVLAVNWWATFPASPVPGLVLAHDAYQLLRQGASGAVSDPALAPELLRQARVVAAAAAATRFDPSNPSNAAKASDPSTPSDIGPLLRAALGPGEVAAIEERAVLPDELYRRVFAERLSAAGSPPRAAALYLPALDIAAAGWQGGALAFADLVRAELRAADQLLASAVLQSEWGSVAVVLDPGRRRPGSRPPAGRVLLWQRRGACDAGPADTTPEAIAAGLLRTLGLPQSAELPPPPPQCSWPDPPASVPTYGRPQPRRLLGARDAGTDGAEYLQSLRSLGYL